MNANPFVRLCLSLPPLLAATLAFGQAGPSNAATEFSVDGIHVIVQPRPASATVAAGIFFRGGRLNQSATNAGIEELLLASALEGTERFPRDALRDEVARLAATLDYKCFNDYSVVSVRCTVEAFARAFALAADAALHPALENADVERVRTRLVAVASSAADIERVRRRLGEAWIHAGHPYAPPGEGTPQTLGAITLADLRAHHRLLLAKSRIVIVVAGGVDAAGVRAVLGDMFATLPADPARPLFDAVPYALVPPLPLGKPAFRRAGFVTSVPRADVLFSAPAPDAPDFPALQMAVAILQNRLIQSVRDQAQLSYDPAAELEVHAAPHGAIRFSASDLDAAARLVADEIDRLRREPVPGSLLAATAAQLRSDEYTEAVRNDAQIGRLAEFELVRGGWRRSFNPPYATVTPDALRQAAQRYFVNLQYLVLAPGSVRPDEKAFAR